MVGLVSLQSVSRTFRIGPVCVSAVRDVSFEIASGECVAIVGPSGSGKSTLMNMIGLLDRPTEGIILLEGRDVARLSDNDQAMLRARKIGFVFQSYNLLARHTAIENVTVPLLYSSMERKARLARAEQALELVGMLHRARHYPRQLSGGEQQRVAIARALVGSPSIILADEPTGALDTRTGAEILDVFWSLNRTGQTLMVVTHDPGVAALCKRTISIRDGQILSDVQQAHSTPIPTPALLK